MNGQSIEIDLLEEGEISTDDFEHALQMIKEGYREDEICSSQKDGSVVRGWWKINKK